MSITKETPDHWQRRFLASKAQVAVIRSELNHLYINCVKCPDTEASYKKIIDTLNAIEAGWGSL